MKVTKKTVAVLFAGALLAGCAGNTQANNGIIAAVNGDHQVTAQNFYDDMMANTNAQASICDYIIEQLIRTNYPVTDAMETEVQLNVENIQNQYTTIYGAEAENYLNQALNQSGFASLEDYQEAMLYSFEMREFLQAYVDEHFEELFNDYYETKNPRYVSHVLIKMEDPDNPTEEEQAKLDEVQKLIDEKQDFAEIAKEHSDDTSASNGGALGICDEDTNFVTEFKEVALALKPGEISPATKSEYGYHFIMVTSTDKEEMKKDEQVTDDLLLSYDPYLLYVACGEYDLDIKDEKIKEIYENTLQERLEAREESRKESDEA